MTEKKYNEWGRGSVSDLLVSGLLAEPFYGLRGPVKAVSHSIEGPVNTFTVTVADGYIAEFLSLLERLNERALDSGTVEG